LDFESQFERSPRGQLILLFNYKLAPSLKCPEECMERGFDQARKYSEENIIVSVSKILSTFYFEIYPKTTIYSKG
jgi:hypothetical protein